MAEPSDKTVLATGEYLRFVRQGRWEFVERTGIGGVVVLVPVTDDGKLVLVEQFRPAVGARVVELPAGLVGDVPGQENEPLERAARRELWEETGYEADEVREVAEGPHAAGSVSVVLTMFLCRGLRKTGPGGGDETEDIVVHEVPLGEVESFCAARQADGRLIDIKLFGGLYFARNDVPSCQGDAS